MDERNSSTPGAGSPGSGMAEKVRASAAAQLNTQKDRATDGIGNVAQAVRQTTQQLRENQHETVAQYVEQAADQLERFSQSLKNKDVGELVSDAQRLARRQPALFVGGAFALGLAGARFFKSSPSNERYQYDRGDYRGEYGAPYGRENYRAAAGSGEYERPDWRSPSVTTGSGTSGAMTGAGTSGSGSTGSTSAKRSTGEGPTRSRTNKDSERS
jgi:hypothetical protein